MNDFTHCHVHSEYSLLDGQAKVKKLVSAAKKAEMSALAITDHGSMHGAIEFYKACREQEIKPIIGLEGYMVPNMRERVGRMGDYNHLLLLATSTEGYHNLMRLTTLTHTQGFHYKPRMDKNLLAQHARGLVATSGCLAGEIPELLLAGKITEAERVAGWYQDVFGRDRFYIELQDHLAPESPQVQLNPLLLDLAKRMDAPLLATNDLHYVGHENERSHDVLLCIQMGANIGDTDRMRFDSGEYYLKTPDEMARLFSYAPKALSNSLKIAEMTDIKIEFGRNLIPEFPPPPGFASDVSYFDHLCRKGLRWRYGEITGAIEERYRYEFNIIRAKGFIPYFLVVWDYVNFARSRGMRCVARGSVAGSVIAYALGMSNIDPLAYDLLFERFLNPERTAMPDIDMDFPDDRREEVIRYVAERYGWDRVAQICTFNVLGAKSAVRDVGRVLDQRAAADVISREMTGLGSVSIKEALAASSTLKSMYETDQIKRQILDMASELEGHVRNTGIHAAGVIISREPLVDIVPLQLRDTKDAKSWLVAQYEQAHLEELGLLKMDFLGLSNLTILQDAISLIKQRHGVELDIDRIPVDDKAAFELLAAGETTGIFQLESPAMRAYIRELKPSRLEDIIAMVALYRPGPMDSIPQFIRAKHHPEETTYAHPILEPILKATYGVIVYQDQVLQTAITMAGFSWGEVDKFRKAMGKKLPAELIKYREKFIKGAIERGVDDQIASDVFTLVEPFGGYGFNKCLWGSTEVQTPDGKSMALSAAYKSKPREIMAMWPDGQIRPHKVHRIVQSGRKPLLQVRTASGKSVKATKEHRLLTTEGYMAIGDMHAGTELIVAPKRVTERQRTARRATMARLNQSPESRQRSRERLTRYQETLTFAERSEHQKRVSELYPELRRQQIAAAGERARWLWHNDPEWRVRFVENSFGKTRIQSGWGECSIASNGMFCASRSERDMCEWLITQGIEFEMHKVLANGCMCDFYFNGIYWEMDGIDRKAEYFAEKYGDLPYVVVTPEDFQPVVLKHLGVAHAENGDPIVSIEPCGEAMTYDIEMEPDGPLNFIANRLVSHNSHAASYGLVAYQTAYLKAHFPAEFMAASMSKEVGNKIKIATLVEECRRLGIKVRGPHINKSRSGFTVEDLDCDGHTAIRMGFSAISGIGERYVASIISEREENGAFTSIADVFRTSRITASTVEKLAKVGAFDEFIGDRGHALTVVEEVAKRRKSKKAAQVEQSVLKQDETSEKQRLAWEYEALGIYLTGHPLNAVADALRSRVKYLTGDLASEEHDKETVLVGGRLIGAEKMTTRKGEPMGVAVLEDVQGTIDVVAFPQIFPKISGIWKDESIVLISGQYRFRDGEPQIVVGKCELFDGRMGAGVAGGAAQVGLGQNEPEVRGPLVRITIPPTAKASITAAIQNVLAAYPGDSPYEAVKLLSSVPVRFSSSAQTKCFVRYCPELEAQLSELVGAGSVALVEVK